MDVVGGPSYGISADSALRPYFIAFVYPIKRRKRVPEGDGEKGVPAAVQENSGWSIAAYRHELVLQTNSFLSQGPFYSAGGVIPNARLFGLVGDRDIRLVTYGASAAYKVSEHLSLGEGGIIFYRFSLDSHFASLGFTGNSFSPVDVQIRRSGDPRLQQGGGGAQAAINLGALVTSEPGFSDRCRVCTGKALPFSLQRRITCRIRRRP